MKRTISKNIFSLCSVSVAVCILSALAVFTACENNTPFDTQTADDAPLILVPYETSTGQLSYTLANPDTPLKDSVVVTPSAHTTVNWYLDNTLVNTGTKINMCFLAGHYTIKIEAVTTAGKSTSRTGTVTVNSYPTDPSSSAPAAGRHFVPGTASTITGTNLTQVKALVLSRDMDGKDVVATIEVTTTDDAELTFDLPEMADGVYYLRLQDAEGKLYGADEINVHNAAVALAGYEEFVPGEAWTITGVKLENVASVKVDETVVTEITATATSITFTAPAAEVGEHTLSIANKDGSAVNFITADGLVTQVKTIVSAETTLWTGPNYLQWNENRVRVESADMAQVPAGATIFIYYEKLPAGHEGYYEGTEYKEYQKMKVMTAWWTDLFSEFDVTDDTPKPYSFTYTADMKALVDAQNAFCVAGWGLNINKITFK